MADRGDRFLFFHEVRHKLDRFANHPQPVGICHAAGQQDRIKILRSHRAQSGLDLEFIAFLIVAHPLDLAAFRRHQCRLCPRLVERFPRLCHFYLFEAIGN